MGSPLYMDVKTMYFDEEDAPEIVGGGIQSRFTGYYSQDRMRCSMQQPKEETQNQFTNWYRRRFKRLSKPVDITADQNSKMYLSSGD